MSIAIDLMRISDIPAVSAIERLSFPQPWPQSAYRREIQENKTAYYIIARLEEGSVPTPQPAAAETALPAQRADEGLFGRLQRLFGAQQQASGAPAGEQGIIGYAGLWLMSDEAHVTTIAVHPGFRGKHVGELLLLSLIDRALVLKARWLTLEVRVSNEVAQALYRKYTFKEMGVRRRYYSDNGEDALIMWTEPLDSERLQQVLAANRAALQQRLVEAE